MVRYNNPCCGNKKCRTRNSPLFRKGWIGEDGKYVMLCNACGLHYMKGHYCYFCYQIYRESDADDISDPWIGCDRCSKWIHLSCEMMYGIGNIKDLSGEYFCPECRELKKKVDEETFFQTVPTKRRRRVPKKQRDLGYIDMKIKKKETYRTKKSTPSSPNILSLFSNTQQVSTCGVQKNIIKVEATSMTILPSSHGSSLKTDTIPDSEDECYSPSKVEQVKKLLSFEGKNESDKLALLIAVCQVEMENMSKNKLAEQF